MVYTITSAATRGRITVQTSRQGLNQNQWLYNRDDGYQPLSDNGYQTTQDVSVNWDEQGAIEVYWNEFGGNYTAGISRYFMAFSTLSVGQNRITSAKLWVYFSGNIDNNIMVVQAEAPSTTEDITGFDFKAITGYNDGDSMLNNTTDYIATPVAPTDGWNAIPLNANAIEAFNSGQEFRIALVDYDYDYQYQSPPLDSQIYTGITISGTEPYLEVETGTPGLGQYVLSISPELYSKVNSVPQGNIKLVNRLEVPDPELPAVYYPITLDTTNKSYTSAKYASYIHNNYDVSPGSFPSNDSRFINLYASSNPIVVGTTIYSDNTGSLYVIEGEEGWHQRQGGSNPLIYNINSSSQVSSIYTSVYESPDVAPTTPLNFTAMKSILGGTSRYITFTWDASTDNDMLHHYNLYCSYFTGASNAIGTIHIVPAIITNGVQNYAAPRDYYIYPSGFPATKNIIRISNSKFSDFNGVAGASWHVKAVDISGNESAASNVITLPTNAWVTPSPSALGQASLNWKAMCAIPNGDVYAAVFGGDIYKQTGGTGNFVATSQTSRQWTAMCSAPNGDIYAAAYETSGGFISNIDVYKKLSGYTTFTALGQSSILPDKIEGLTADLNGDIYATLSGSYFNPGTIYKLTTGTANFVSAGQTARYYGGLATGPNGDIYTTALDQTGQYGILYVKPAASSTFSAFQKNGSGVTTQGRQFSIAPNTDMWGFGASGSGDVYKLEFEQLTYPVFQPLGQTLRNWSGTCVRTTATGYNVYFCVYGGDIYKYSYVN